MGAGGDSGPVVLLCAEWPTQGLPENAAPGTVRRQCHACLKGVQVSPTGMQTHREEGALFSCLACGRVGAGQRKAVVLPRTIDEAQRHLGLPRAQLERYAAQLEAIPLSELIDDSGDFR